MALFRNRRASDAPRPVMLEEKGQHWLNRIVSAPNKEPWGVTLASLAWTAGPATYLAALGGYYIGYGEMISFDRTLYFIGYSVIAGILGLTFKLFYNVTAGNREETQKRKLTETIDKLPDIIHRVRDLQLENLSEETRTIEAAGMLLNKLDLGPEWISTAVEDLSGNLELAGQARKIEIFRRAGLYQRMQDVIREAAPTAEQAADTLRQTHPQIAHNLMQRMQGIAPSSKRGRPRDPLFIERILSAIENDNAELMTLRDVEEMLTLCFELICGREIAYLKFDYTGDWDIAKAFDRLEEDRNDYRLSRARVYSRLRALASYLNYCDANEDISNAAGLSPQTLLNASIEAIDNLTQAVNELRNQTLGDNRHALALQIRTNQLEKAVELYNEARRAYLHLNRNHENFSKAMQRWQKLTRVHHSDLQARENLKRSLMISECIISLDPEEKLKLALHLANYFSEASILFGHKHGQNPVLPSQRRLTVTKAKEIAIEVTLALEPYIKLHSPQVQRAIYSAHSALISTIAPGASAKTKAGLGEALSLEVEKDLAQAAERLAQNLIRYYRVPLSQGTINFLVNTYNASRERLNFIAEHEAPYSGTYSPLNATSVKIPFTRNSWHISLYNAKRVLGMLK
ncbi:hypothetical protein [Aestuariirhabdus litorea]|uniref:Uncharacterized protein n=1 Tax=Aestuariirhabdus litorea TaxID=2528527 RepID=A0A3P3VMR7_9GAMM|nr:hypothetical protein [Aestuariirhabdus litorea]RRJ84052.1 hypothetical protein D0544_02725 [Aestuariirhabdus litorea]RWW97272.1 hypothetical protein DZC74_02720 [Endozoicomonadaceae bacterium GTF-13]